MTRFWTRAAVAFGVFCIVGCGDAEAPASRVASGPADPTDASAVARGETVYAAHCASCHGARLEGQPNWKEPLANGAYPAPPHDGTGHTWRHSDQQLFDATKFGGGFSAAPESVSAMPAFEPLLSDDEIWAALAFVKSHWPLELRVRQRMLTRARKDGPGEDHSGHMGHSEQ